ncbi:MAG TPA: Uma2 family endonuclease [Verrucomicrobiae bacterium]|jgi:Uma2 family endonuclease|nr:Uma2 family endonuclease [Verrucomicrobiae bacterium]
MPTLVSQRFFGDIPAMQTAVKNDLVSVEDYLAAEETSEIRHEYLGGLVYAMAGETTTHNQIVGNLYLAIRNHLKNKPCRVYMSDIRVNFDIRDDEYFYYPDIVVTCDKRDTHPRFVRHPRLIIEVLSESTERIDKREKFFAYTGMPSLDEYVLVAQNAPEITLFRRSSDWKAEKISGTKATASLRSLKLSLPLSAVYEGV